MGQQLGVDVQLSDAAGDELRELRAEVEDDDRVGSFRGLRGARRRRSVQRLLEIGLDLDVVGGQDAMAGVGRLAVDGATALRAQFASAASAMAMAAAS